MIGSDRSPALDLSALTLPLKHLLEVFIAGRQSVHERLTHTCSHKPSYS